LERKKLKDEYDELKRLIAYLEDLLAHPEQVLALIKSDLLAIKEKYGDARRTQIVDRTKGALTTTDLLPDQTVWVAVGDDGELRRHGVVKLTHSSLRQAARGSEIALLTANTRDLLYLFTKDGRCGRVSIHEIPPDGSAKHLAELCGFTRRDRVTAALTLPRPNGDPPTGFLFFATEQGMVKRVSLADVTGLTSEAVVMNVDDKDRLISALCTRGDQEVVLVTADGQSIRFGEEDVRSMGLAAGGVGGVKLGKGDRVIFAGVVDPDGALLTVTGLGFAKRSPLSDYSRQGRNGGGIVTHKLSAKTGKVAAATIAPGKNPPHWLAVLRAKGGTLTVALDEIPITGRGVLGKQIIDATASAPVTALSWVIGAGGETPAEEVVPASAPVKPTERTRAKPAAQPSPQAKAQPPLRMVAPKSATPPVALHTETQKSVIAGAAKVDKKAALQETAAKTEAKSSAVRAQSAGRDLSSAATSPQAQTQPPAQAGLFDEELATPKATKAGKLQTVVSVKKQPGQPK
jgi:DNA gyrase subunit A